LDHLYVNAYAAKLAGHHVGAAISADAFAGDVEYYRFCYEEAYMKEVKPRQEKIAAIEQASNEARTDEKLRLMERIRQIRQKQEATTDNPEYTVLANKLTELCNSEIRERNEIWSLKHNLAPWLLYLSEVRAEIHKLESVEGAVK
jgi:hypothetical protein